ncbi:GNAT family N-acetyltransferase [uncultured Bartonella sp.]|uniref:GNAT family N-acetyltransferase n=1 Tax=uncultured Bartonella sp. TaxID=104108 RepID=UPI00260E91BC|nr:GNAT family N-acetyltransferase [uncultured Bartonella sp.]
MTKGDLADVCRIAALCHPDFPEDEVVFNEKYTLSPDTCFILNGENNSVGYILAHPFKSGAIPPLNCLLGRLPRQSDTLYIHDLALLPQARNGGNGKKAVKLMCDSANEKKLKLLSLVAVNGSTPFWQKMGFERVIPPKELKEKLLTYSSDACYMERAV